MNRLIFGYRQNDETEEVNLSENSSDTSERFDESDYDGEQKPEGAQGNKLEHNDEPIVEIEDEPEPPSSMHDNEIPNEEAENDVPNPKNENEAHAPSPT